MASVQLVGGAKDLTRLDSSHDADPAVAATAKLNQAFGAIHELRLQLQAVS
jgi:hypothetical protein